MKLEKKDWLYVAGAFVLTIIVLKLFSKKMKPQTIRGSYVVPQGTPNMADALHSFEKRKSDGFGGRVCSQINEKLRELYRSGVNPDVVDLKIVVDSKNYKVDWEATIQPSTNGKAYVGVSTFGSAGGGADARATGQYNAMTKWNAGATDYTLLLDFKNPKGIYIRQFFYKWTNPTQYPPH